jgi:transcriptional regulator with XRE-family HTH domain
MPSNETPSTPDDRADALIAKIDKWTFDSVVPTKQKPLEYRQHSSTGTLVIQHVVLEDESNSRPQSYKASAGLIDSIAGWIGHYHYLDLGGTEDIPAPEKIRGWIVGENAFVLLKYAGRNDSSPEVLAFATVAFARTASFAVEVGRLIVPTEERNIGIGQAFLSNLAQAVALSFRGAQIYARLSKRNPEALYMMYSISRFERVEFAIVDSSILDLVKKPETVPKYVWFKWNNHGELVDTSFGSEFRKEREQRKISQQIVAQRASISREALNQIENGGNPHHDNVNRLLDALSISSPLGSKAKLNLLCSLHKVALPADLLFAEAQNGNDDIDPTSESRWIISDRPDEAIEDEEFGQCVDAILKGYSRYFFIPSGAFHSPYGNILIQRIVAALIERIGPKHINANALLNLRIYSAPSCLCRQRLVIRGIESTSGRPTRFRSMSMSGPVEQRIPIDASQSILIFNDICDAIRPSFKAGMKSRERTILLDGFIYLPLDEAAPILRSGGDLGDLLDEVAPVYESFTRPTSSITPAILISRKKAKR